MSKIPNIFKALLALLILATASLTIPSEASAKGHGNGRHAGNNKHEHHKKHHHKHKKHKKGGGGFDDDGDDDDDDDCKIIWTKHGWVRVCDADDDDDDDD